jgi:hypothetical protein
MSQEWNSFMLQLQLSEESRVARRPRFGHRPHPPSPSSTAAATIAAAEMTSEIDMKTGWVWVFNPAAPGSTGSKDDTLWFEFKVQNLLLMLSFAWNFVGTFMEAPSRLK